MDRWRGRLAVVTGAASGIGSAITQGLLSAGVRVVGIDVKEKKLEEMAEQQRRSTGAAFYALKCDVGDGAQLERAFNWINSELGGLQIMVNNAGIIYHRNIIDSSREEIERLLNVNLIGMANCSALAVQSMRKNCCEGHIFNINSVLGHTIPVDFFNIGLQTYPAGKHGGVALTTSLRHEITKAGLPIKVTSISPGLTKTEMVNKDLSKLNILDPEDIADALLYALGTKPKVQVTEVTIRSLGETV